MSAVLQEAVPALLGNWELPNAPSPSYGPGTATEQDLPRWRLNLPADPSSAEGVFARLEAQQREIDERLTEYPERIEYFIARIRTDQTRSVSFNRQEDDYSAPEDELLSLIRALNAPRQEVSFSQGEGRVEKLHALFALFRAEMDMLMRMTAHLAWIETQVEGTLIGCTIVSWSGDMDNTWRSPLQRNSCQLHRRSLAQALASRFALLRTSFLVINSAARLAPLLTTPAGALFSLPLAWNFLKQLLTELETDQKPSRNLP